MYIKASDRLHLISPKFNAVWVFLRQVINIYNAPTDAELSGAFHLIALFIAHFYQLSGNVSFIYLRILVNFEKLLPENRQRHLRRHQSAKSGDHRHRLTLQHSAETSDPFCYKLIPVNISLIKDQILCRIAHGISVIKTAVLQKLLYPKIAERNDQPVLTAFRKAIDHMHLLGFHAAGKRNTAILLFQLFFDLVKLTQFLKRGCQCSHFFSCPSCDTLRLNSFMA